MYQKSLINPSYSKEQYKRVFLWGGLIEVGSIPVSYLCVSEYWGGLTGLILLCECLSYALGDVRKVALNHKLYFFGHSMLSSVANFRLSQKIIPMCDNFINTEQEIGQVIRNIGRYVLIDNSCLVSEV